ncbi:hypothetical protein K503DRAFT_689488, partial [Rhizopogon vinicolor AM-OR11-026]
AILDVAFAEEEPPIAVNIVHPRPVAWTALMHPIADAIFQRKITGVLLPLIPFSEWLEKLELSAENTSIENLKRIPAIKLIDFIRHIAQSDIGGTPEAGGIPFATGVAQRVSPTMKELEPLSAADATQWVNYWAAVGMFQ